MHGPRAKSNPQSNPTSLNHFTNAFRRFPAAFSIAVLLIAVALPALAALGSSTNPPAANAPAGPKGKHFDRVLVIVLENQNYESAMRDPYLASLASQGASFSNFKALFHPSYPNYIAMVAGNSFGIQGDSQVNLPDDDAHRTIADLLDWRAYAENYPGRPSDDRAFLRDRGKYARKHVPLLSFASVQEKSFHNVVGVDTHDPHNAFVTDVEMFRKDPKLYPLPRYMFYSPNLDDDGHDPYFFPARGLRKASTWLQHFLTTWFPLDDKMKGTLVVITYDESEGFEKSNRIYTVFLGDMVKPGEVTHEYNHYSVLRTIEDNFGLQPLSDGDRAAEPITDIWK